MIKIWGRNTSSNVQKAMWAVDELDLERDRIDIGGAFGMNKEPKYLAMNPNGLVPTLEEEDGFLLWESNSIVRYLAGKHDKAGVLEPKDAKQRARASQWMDWQLSVVGPAITAAFWGLIRTPAEKRDMAAIKAGVLEPKDEKQRARASQWMDWQLSVAGPAITPAFWGLIRTPAEKRDMAAIKASQEKTTDCMKILDAQLAKTPYVAGPAFSYGDIPVAVMCYRYRQLVPGRPPTPNLDRWYDAIAKRKPFHDNVGSIPLS